MPGGFGSTPVRKRAGQRRERVTLWSSDTSVDALLSQEDGDYSQFGTDQASVEEIPFIVNASEHGMLYKVTIRYRDDIITEFETEKKRVQVRTENRTLTLLEIENPERRHVELILHCAVA